MLLFYVSPLILSTMLGVVLVLFIARNSRDPSAPSLVILILAATLWSLGYAMEEIYPNLEEMLFWARIEYFGITAIPIAWLAFVAQYTGATTWKERMQRYFIVFAFIPILTLALVWTNDLHHLVWRQIAIETLNGVSFLKITHGVWFYINIAYSYVLMLLGSHLLIQQLVTRIPLQRWQILLSLIAVVIPWLGNFIYATGINPIPTVDWTPFGFILAGLLLSISLFRFRMAGIRPIQQKSVFDGLADSFIVLNLENEIVDLNQAAQKMLGVSYLEVAGRRAGEVFPELARALEQVDSARTSAEITYTLDGFTHFYNIHIVPLTGSHPMQAGRLVILSDITGQKQTQLGMEMKTGGD